MGLRLFLILGQRRFHHWRALKYQTLRGANHSIYNGAIKQLASRPHHHPAEAGKPTAVMERSKETFAV